MKSQNGTSRSSIKPGFPSQKTVNKSNQTASIPSRTVLKGYRGPRKRVEAEIPKMATQEQENSKIINPDSTCDIGNNDSIDSLEEEDQNIRKRKSSELIDSFSSENLNHQFNWEIESEGSLLSLSTIQLKKAKSSQPKQTISAANVTLSTMKSPVFKSRYEGFNVQYQEEGNKLIVNHSNEKLEIPIFSEDTVGGKYDWKINDVMLGVGSFGRVFKAFCSKQLRTFALKMIEFTDFKSEESHSAIYEILVLKKLQGEQSTIQLYDVFGLQKLNSTLVLVMEYCSCNLFEICKYRAIQKQPWSEPELLSVFLDILAGNEYLFQRNICHRDLKQQNIMYSAKKQKFKIGDFSESKILSKQQMESTLSNQNVELHTFRGTWKYLSPELSAAFNQNKEVEKFSPYHSDLYSLGVMFGDMLFFGQIKFKNILNQGEERQKSNDCFLNELIQLLKDNIKRNSFVLHSQITLALLNVSPRKREEYKILLQGKDLSKLLKMDSTTQTIITQTIAESIELQREEKINIPRYESAKKSYLIAEANQNILQFELAIEHYKRVLELSKHLNTQTIKSRALYYIGYCYERLGLFIESHDYYQECYNFRKLMYKPASKSMGEILNGLGIANINLGNYAEAKIYYEESLKIALDRYGEDHVIIANMHNNLGSVNFHQQKYEEAVNHFQNSIRILKKIKEEHEIFDILNNLAMVYLEQNEFQSSEECLNRSLELSKEQSGENNKNLISIYKNFGQLFSKMSTMKQFGDSIQLLEKSISFFGNAADLIIHFYDEAYYQLGEIYKLIGSSYMQKEDNKLAIQSFKKSIQVFEKQNNEYFLQQVYQLIAVSCIQLKDFEQGIQYLQKAIDIMNKLETSQNKKGDAYYNLGCAYLQQKNYDQASKNLKIALESYILSGQDNQYITLITETLSKISHFISTS